MGSMGSMELTVFYGYKSGFADANNSNTVAADTVNIQYIQFLKLYNT